MKPKTTSPAHPPKESQIANHAQAAPNWKFSVWYFGAHLGGSIRRFPTAPSARPSPPRRGRGRSASPLRYSRQFPPLPHRGGEGRGEGAPKVVPSRRARCFWDLQLGILLGLGIGSLGFLLPLHAA